MKATAASKWMGAGVLALGLSVLTASLPATAQTGSGTTDGTTTTSPNSTTGTTTSRDVDNKRDTDWGWLGLIGLAGLAGLAKRPEKTAAYRDPEEARTGSRF